MGRQDLEALARQIEAAEANGEVTGRLLADALSEAFPAQVEAIRRLGRHTGDMAAMLEVISAAFPGWTVALRGKASLPDGSWTCSLRESGVRDDDDVIGIGKAKTPTLAIAAAALLAQARR
jgi:hypothetical protein